MQKSLTPILTRCVCFLFIYIAAQEATETQAFPLAGALCLLLLDTFLLIICGRGLVHYLKSSEK